MLTGTLRLKAGEKTYPTEVQLIIWEDDEGFTHLGMGLSSKDSFVSDLGVRLKSKPSEVIEELKSALKHLEDAYLAQNKCTPSPAAPELS
jgi:hypothetical protein